VSESRTWDNYKERGSEWFFRGCLWIYRLLGWTVSRWLVYPVVAFFFLTSSERYQHSRTYFKRLASTEKGRETLGHEPGWRDSYRQYLEFGKGMFNRVSLWLGHEDRYEVEFPDREMFLDYVNNDRGAVLLSFHVGHFDVMRYFALSKGVVVNVVAYWNNTEALNQLLESVDESSQVNLITIDPGDPRGIIELKERVNEGEFVAILGDRVTLGPKDRYQEVPFLGKKAPFPEGPFLTAYLLECPILLTSCVRVGERAYQVNMERFSETVDLPRSDREEQLEAYIRQYARALEDVCQQYPYQWFNFHDFWSHPNESK
jgi:predicted LPLAT superfamily acyltransferase